MIHYQDWNDQAIHKHLRLKLEPSMHELGQNWLLIPLNHITSKFRQEECGVQLAARRSELSQQPQDLCNGTKSMARGQFPGGDKDTDCRFPFGLS